MVFIAYGLNHKTAPLTLREKFALSTTKHEALLCQLLTIKLASEAALLSTCNRTEIYCVTSNPQELIHWFAQQHDIDQKSLSPHCYLYPAQEGIRHTLRVASGLDSMMLGEPQILGQMKAAFQQACQLGTIKTDLRQIFDYVFKASKRIRTLSGIGTNPLSIAYAAAQLVKLSFREVRELRVFLIGSGETASLVANYLYQQGVKQFLVASRTLEHAAKLAIPFNGTPLAIQDIANYLPEVDVVISATACPFPFITKNLVEQTLSRRDNRDLFFLDLALPRDIEEGVGLLPQVTLFNLDDLQKRIHHNLSQRQDAALAAEQMIEGELDHYVRWHRGINAKRIICQYRESMHTQAKDELTRSLKQLKQGLAPEQILQELTKRLVNKLTHSPSVGLRQAALDDKEHLLSLMQYLYPTPETQIADEKIT